MPVSGINSLFTRLSHVTGLLILLVSSTFGPFSSAQAVHPKLVVAETKVVESLSDASTLIPIKTDTQGNIYLRFYQPQSGQAPVVKILRGGTETTIYKLAGIPQDAFSDKNESSRASMADFSVSPSGDLNMLVAAGSHTYLAEFSSKGEFEGLTQVHLDELSDRGTLSLWQLVALPDQHFFVVGTFALKSGEIQPLNAIFGGDGRLLAEVELKGDVQAPQGANPEEAALAQSKFSRAGGALDQGIQTGTALAGDDGNLYLMRALSPFKLFVVSGGGQVLRVLPVEPPMPGASLDTFKVHSGRVAIEFSKPTKPDLPDEIVFRVLDSTGGAVLGDYLGSAETSRWASYADDGFLFLGAKDHKIAQIRAMLP